MASRIVAACDHGYARARSRGNADHVKRYLRSDKGELASPVRTSQGLRVEGYAGRPGIYEYTNTREDEADGLGKAGTKRRELRPASEAFAPEALASYEAAPFTNGHPGKLISGDAKLRAQHSKGTVLSARRDGDRVATAQTIHDPTTITDVEGGKRELSPGYTMELDRTSGTDPTFGAYDVVQRNIRVDHLALVDRARGGRGCALRLDADGETIRIDAAECYYGDDVEGCDGDCMDETKRREDAELSADARNALADERFALPADRKLPIHDKKHVVAAMGGHGLDAVKGVSDEDKKTAARKIAKKAEALGVDASGFKAKHGVGDDAKRSDMADDKKPIPAPTGGAESIDELRAQRDEAKSRANRLDAESASLKSQLADVTAKLAAGADAAESLRVTKEKQRADSAEEKLHALESTYEQRVRSAAELRSKARVLLGPDVRLDGMADDDVSRTVLKRLTPKEPFEQKDAEWRRVRVDELEKNRATGANERDAIARAVRTDAEPAARADEKKIPWGDSWKAGPPQTTAAKKKEH